MKTEILKIGVPNSSGRIYSREVVEKAIEDITYKYGTPDKDSYGLKINLDKVTHKATNFIIENNKLYCDITVLNTPMGQILSSLINCKAPIRYFSSGTGEVDKEYNVTNYKLVAVNWQIEI